MEDLEISIDKLIDVLTDPNTPEEKFLEALVRVKTIRSMR